MTCNPIALLKCLSDETRLKIVVLLVQNDSLCVCDLHETLEESQPKVSRHLAELRRCEVLITDKRGKWVHYQLNPDLPAWGQRVIKETVDACRVDYPELFERLSLTSCEKQS